MPSQDREPGRSTAYSNYSAALAGHLVAEVSGMSWEDYLDRNILEPLHMTRTSGRQPRPEHLPEGMTKVYNSLNGDLVEAEYDIVALAPFDGMVATSQDMANFMIAHLQDGRVGETRILQEATAQQMHRQLFTQDPRLAGNAHGFWESTENGQHVLSHPGDHNTSMTGLWLLPDHDLGLNVAYNSDRGGEARAGLWEAFRDHTFPTAPTTPPDPTPGAEEDLERFEGNYANSRVSSTTPGKLFLLAAMTVSAQEGDLATDLAGYESTRWTAIGHDAFVSADGRSRMILSGDAGQPQRPVLRRPVDECVRTTERLGCDRLVRPPVAARRAARRVPAPDPLDTCPTQSCLSMPPAALHEALARPRGRSPRAAHEWRVRRPRSVPDGTASQPTRQP
jgi:hypothetical protein